ncbi:MAG: sugar phosphate isomerase/epimerase [Treponema sp.]|nr:sugar phosphate isomerase/epimerase [Treponema sp.]
MIDLHLSTIGADAAALAREHGFGIEIAEFSYAANMDADFPRWDTVTRENLEGIQRRVFHAPFNELCPAAIDPLVAELTRKRLEQAYQLTRRYGIRRMVVHSGYIPHLYVHSYFTERSVQFWRDFLLDKPADFSLLLENTLEEGPDMLRDIVEKTGDPRLQLCLDLGHAGGHFSDLPVSRWIETFAPYLAHVHIHNNYRTGDLHNPPGDGLIDIQAALAAITELRPGATYTAETAELRKAAAWLESRGFLNQKITG